MSNTINLQFDATRLFIEVVRTQSMVKCLAFHSLGASKYSDFINDLHDHHRKALIDFVENNRDIVSDANETIRKLIEQMES